MKNREGTLTELFDSDKEITMLLDERRQATRYLRGLGIEIGPSHLPIEVDRRCCDIIYVDRLSASQMEARFPELSEARIVFPNVICDVAAEGLRCFADERLDFVIASHLLEHLPNPLGFLKESHRVLSNLGIFYLVVPDKDYTFDRDRQKTPLAHIVQDLENNTVTVDESHLIDFLVHAAKKAIPNDPVERTRLFERELERSIHVHVWTWEDVVELLRYMIIHEGVAWELCEAYLPKGVKHEAIFVLRKVNLPPDKTILQFDSSIEILVAREKATEAAIGMLQEQEKVSQNLSEIERNLNEMHTRAPEIEQSLNEVHTKVSEIEQSLNEVHARVSELYRFYTLPIRGLRKMLRWMRFVPRLVARRR